MVRERIIPGTSVLEDTSGAPVVANVGQRIVAIIGTACKGPVNEVHSFANFTDFQDYYGPIDLYDRTGLTVTEPLTLTRAAKLAFAGGAGIVIGVRAGAAAAVKASDDFAVASGELGWEAKNEGIWYCNMQYKVEVTGTDARFDLRLPGNLYIEYPDGTSNMWAGVTMDDSQELYVEFTVGTTDQIDTDELEAAVNSDPVLSQYIVLTEVTPGTLTEKAIWTDLMTAAGTAGTNWSADDTALLGSTDIDVALAKTEIEVAHIVVIGNADEAMTGYFSSLSAHVATASGNKRERVGIAGSKVDTEANHALFWDDVDTFRNARNWFVVGGVLVANPYYSIRGTYDIPVGTPEYDTFSGGMFAAWIAGLVASRGWHEGITNVPVSGFYDMEHKYTLPTVRTCIQKGLIIVKYEGDYRIARGVTNIVETDYFYQLNIRSTVDYAIYGVRKLGDAFIGNLNLEANRNSLRGSILNFLNGMAVDRMVVDYSGEVTATRAQEIAGVVDVRMGLQPTHLMDFIEVTFELS